MKTLLLSLTVIANATLGFIVLPSGIGTNKLAPLQAGQILEVSHHSFASGQLDRLQTEVSLLQIEFLFLAIAVGAGGAACLFTIQRIREASRIHKTNVNASHT